MTLDEMCISAARYSDRYDEFEKTEDDEGNLVYEDDAEHYLKVFKDAINEAYFRVAREFAMPDIYVNLALDEERRVDLCDVEPGVYGIKDVLNEHRTMNLRYNFVTKYVLEIPDANPGETITLYYHYVPDRLEELTDSPIFPESLVDPMVYISLAVARIWMSEKKFDFAERWLAQYHDYLSRIKSSLNSRINRRIPKRLFR